MNARLKEKSFKLQALYQEYEAAVGEQTAGAVCRPGCSDCCTNVGSIDATTLEGWAVHTLLQRLPSAAQKDFSRKLKSHRKERDAAPYSRCAFLLKDRTCAIYPVRPFSCRRLYSVTVCGETGPTVHRRVWEVAERFTAAIQALDDTGYSGQLAHVLALLKDATFRNLYLEGGFDPGTVQAYAREHGMSINRFLTSPP